MTEITYILLAIIVAVVLIDLYIKRKNKLATTKEIEKVVDEDNLDKKKWLKNKFIIIISSVVLGAGLIVLNYSLGKEDIFWENTTEKDWNLASKKQ